MNESLIKYLAGLLDADGALSFNFRDTGKAGNRTGRYTVALRLTLAAAETIDKDGFVRSLPALTGMGTVMKERNLFWWRVGKRAELEMLLPRIIKHMVIKAKHWQWLLDTWRSYRGAMGECLCDQAGRLQLSEQSKVSRSNVGPLKPKNHPTWAWTAGYMDGDGTYHFGFQTIKARDGKPQRKCRYVRMTASAHVTDSYVLEFLARAFGGHIYNQTPDGRLKVWQRSLGKDNRAFAQRFLPKVAKHSRFKRHKIEAILNHSHQQRLSVPTPTGEAIV